MGELVSLIPLVSSSDVLTFARCECFGTLFYLILVLWVGPNEG